MKVDPAIVLDGVSVRYGTTLALDAVSLRLDAGRVAVIGSNGSGKSTFARLVGGLTRPSGGRTIVHGLDPVRQAQQLRRAVGFVFSNPDAQIVMPTVAEDAAFSLRGSGLSKGEIAERVAEALARFGLAELAERSAHELSGGQKQLLALCGAFIRRPLLLIADEPTAYLDARNSLTVSRHLLETDGRHDVLLVTHDLDLAARCDTVVLFDEGRVTAQGEPAAVIDAYRAQLELMG